MKKMEKCGPPFAQLPPSLRCGATSRRDEGGVVTVGDYW